MAIAAGIANEHYGSENGSVHVLMVIPYTSKHLYFIVVGYQKWKELSGHL